MTNKMKTAIASHQYYNINQFRMELWSYLKTQTIDIARGKANSAEDKALIDKTLKSLKSIEAYWAFPGMETVSGLSNLLKLEEYILLSKSVAAINRILVSEEYRQNQVAINFVGSLIQQQDPGMQSKRLKKKYFEVLFTDRLSLKEEQEIKDKLHEIQDEKEYFSYNTVFAKSFQDTLIALLFNPNIQACVIRYGVRYKSKNINNVLKPFISHVLNINYEDYSEEALSVILGEAIRKIRPELDIYYVTDIPVNDLADSVLQNFNRVFYRMEDLQELHLSILRGIKERFDTPFYTALKEYSKKPTGVFHAMPVSRGNSVFKSNWIDDFGEFYGRNLFLAETSSTTGGLDSLLQPTGPLKKAQQLAAKAFGSRHTFFVTNGTSTSNKIVLQALLEPDDLVLIDRDCHKSHHYAMMLAGANVVYLDSYPLESYSMYGAVPLETIKSKLLLLKEAGRLNKVKMVILTNCTFDGLVYNVEKVMAEILAIKPDMIFLWDEAWFGFAAFTYTYRQRTAMYVADKLYEQYNSAEYREAYKNQYAQLNKKQGSDVIIPGMPDPGKVKIRVYSTQSTHKTLSSFRQGSMIHIYDEEFEKKSEDSFQEAYMTHTSTSANYQILASLDVGRRQVMFEGFELVEKSIEMAMVLRSKISDHPKLRKYFSILSIKDLVPNEYRQSGQEEYYSHETGWKRLENAWEQDEFVLDPTKINLHIGKTGVDGDTFKNKYLMDQFSIQVNKTSRNTILLMTNIGTTRSSVSYLIGALLKIADQLDDQAESLNKEEQKILKQRINSLTNDNPALPDFSHFHDFFRPVPGIPGGNIRTAFFLAYKEDTCEYIKLQNCGAVMNNGRKIISASFVIPYPPGFPVLVPGQVMTKEILFFLLALDVKEIHGFRPELGLRVFRDEVLHPETEKATPSKNDTTTVARKQNENVKKITGELVN